MNWAVLADVVAGVCFLGGAFFSLAAAVGAVRLSGLFNRMHAVTKPQVLGLILLVTGLAFELREPSVLGMLLLIVVFQLLTAPVAAHMVARTAFRLGETDDEVVFAPDVERSGR
ncbi:MAG TPA: monovalent cation/H(+) antiporter subunit G [Jiangellaceae bacterium]